MSTTRIRMIMHTANTGTASFGGHKYFVSLFDGHWRALGTDIEGPDLNKVLRDLAVHMGADRAHLRIEIFEPKQ